MEQGVRGTALWSVFRRNTVRSFTVMLRQRWFGISMLLLLTAFIMGPMLNVLVWAFTDARIQPPRLIPDRWSFKWWGETFARLDVAGGFVTSVGISFTVTLIAALICLPASYAFARMKFRGRTPFLLSFLMVNAFPRFGLYITIAVVFFRLGLVATVPGVVLIQLVNTLLFMIWIPTSAFQGVDRSLEEAALDAGASPLRVFVQITLPMVLPALSAALLLTFVGTFYETQGALLIGIPNVKTLPVVMVTLINHHIRQLGAVLSVALWVPSVVLLIFAQRVLRGGTLAAGFGL